MGPLSHMALNGEVSGWVQEPTNFKILKICGFSPHGAKLCIIY